MLPRGFLMLRIEGTMSERLGSGIVGADAKGRGWAPLAHIPALHPVPEDGTAARCTTREDSARAAGRYRYPERVSRIAGCVDAYRQGVASRDVDVVARS